MLSVLEACPHTCPNVSQCLHEHVRTPHSSPHNTFAQQLCAQVLLGRLRLAEAERIAERLRHSVLEIILSWSMFGAHVDLSFIALMAALGFVKVFHWLAQDRVNFMQTEPRISRLQHARTVACLALLAVRC